MFKAISFILALGLLSLQGGPIGPTLSGVGGGGGNGDVILTGVSNILYVSATSTNLYAVRGDITRPAGYFWLYTNSVAYGVCAQATNGDTIVVLPGNYVATILPLNQGVKVVGWGNPFIKRTNFWLSGVQQAYTPNRSFVYLNDNVTIEGVTLQCGTNNYDSVFGPNFPDADNLGGPVVINGTNITTAPADDVHALYVWPEYGLTNLQAGATNCLVRNCTLRGATDVIYSTWDPTITIDFLDTSYGAPDFGIEVVSNVPPVDVLLDNCRIITQWDWMRLRTSAGTTIDPANYHYRTRNCTTTVTSDSPLSTVGNVAFVKYAGGVNLFGGCWSDFGGYHYIVNSTNATSKPVQTVTTSQISLNNSTFYNSNTFALIRLAGLAPVLRGTYIDGLAATNVVLSGVSAANGAGFTNLNASSLSSGTVPIARLPGITNFTTYASGAAYTLTGTSAALDFGGTDPTLTINQAGTYLIQGNVGIKYSGATYANAQTVTLKFRRTNNTAADLTSGSRTVEMPFLVAGAAFTGGDVMALPPVIYTATSGDTITIFGILSATPPAGSVTADSAEVVAIRLY